jgi:hypothetical protein
VGGSFPSVAPPVGMLQQRGHALGSVKGNSVASLNTNSGAGGFQAAFGCSVWAHDTSTILPR